MLNPRNVRSYARSIGVLAKTDRIDAAVIARFAYVNEVGPKAPPSSAEQVARDLVTRRNQLVADQTREQHQARRPPAQAWPAQSATSPSSSRRLPPLSRSCAK